jgi:hypothetical protein
MGDINEPDDGGYAAVQYRLEPPSVLVYRRDDQAAADAGDPDEHWFCTDERYGRRLTWKALVITGPVAYVGEFVNRGWLP